MVMLHPIFLPSFQKIQHLLLYFFGKKSEERWRRWRLLSIHSVEISEFYSYSFFHKKIVKSRIDNID